MNIQHLLEESSKHHSHLCPRQILGVRIGLAGMETLGLEANQGNKRLLTIIETDGCFADGVIAATGCTVGHRTLRVEDYGKTAATFIDTVSGYAVRIAPVRDIRERACRFLPTEPRHYFAQMQAYQSMPDDQMFSVMEVSMVVPIDQIVSRPGVRVTCDLCGEEILNERDVNKNGMTICRPCAAPGYCVPIHQESSSVYINQFEEAAL